MGKIKKKAMKTEETPDEDEEFTVELVQELGGTKADFEMLKVVEEDGETLDYKEDFETEPINRDDIRGFMEEIGLGDLRRERKIKEEEEKEKERESKPKKIHLAVMPGFEDAEEEKIEDTPTKESKKTKKEKKEKKKIQENEISSTTNTPEKPKKMSLGFINTHRPRKQLLVKPEGKWYDVEFPNDPATFDSASLADVQTLEKFAARLLEEETVLYNKQEESQRKSDTMWIRTVLKSGTLQDKMAALTILIQNSPLHNMSSLDTLVNMAKKKGRREALLAIDTLRELFLSDLMPDRKLKAFDQHPLMMAEELASGNRDMRDKRLLVWYFEAQLKDKYAAFVKALEAMAHDTVSGPKKKAVGLIHHMLTEKPEQEKALLTLLVNKLGDPDYKVASHTGYLLSKLVGSHPNMKFVVVLEVERLLYRPNVASKAQYYAICFLNQLVLRNKERVLAARLITIYFSFFKAYVKRGEVDSKMLSALLMGVNRAYPFAKMEKEKVTEQMDTLYKIVHIVNFNTSIQALMLLYQVIDTSEKSSERYYSALYRKLLDPALKLSSKQTMFLNLLFKSMKADPSERRVQAFTKRLLQVCCHQSAPFICAALILVSELVKQKKNVLQMSKAAEESDDEEEHFVDAPDEEVDEDTNRAEPSAGSDDELHTALKPKGLPTVSSWVHRKNTEDPKENQEYDPLGRNPQYCHAERECTWELQRLMNHFHPTVSLWARTILQGERIHYKSDPLNDFTLIRFLDRFVYRNPKKKESGSEVVTARRKMPGRDLASVNTEEYLALGEEAIPADEKFFFRYFNQKAAKANAKKIEEPDSDASDISDDEFDDYLETFEKGIMEEGKKELDFAGEMKKQKDKKKKKKKGEDEESESEDEGDLTDEEVDLGDLGAEFESMMDDDDDIEDDGEDGDMEDDMGEDDDEPGFDEEDIAFSDEDDMNELPPKKGKRTKDADMDGDDMFGGPPRKREKASKGAGLGGLFASADEFSHLMDDNAGSMDTTGLNAFSNKDNASVKQLKWEADRERWMRDAGRKQKPANRKGGRPGGPKGGKGKGAVFRKGKGKK